MKLFKIITPTFSTTCLGSNITRTRNNAIKKYKTEFLKVHDITKGVVVDLVKLQECLNAYEFSFYEQDVILGLVKQYENCSIEPYEE